MQNKQRETLSSTTPPQQTKQQTKHPPFIVYLHVEKDIYNRTT